MRRNFWHPILFVKSPPLPQPCLFFLSNPLLCDQQGFPVLIQRIITQTSTVVFLPLQSLRSEEHTSELQSRFDLVCRLLLEKKNILVVTYFCFIIINYSSSLLV